MSESGSELEFRPIGPAAPRGFDCGRTEQNDYIHNLACTYSEIGASQTYLAVSSGHCVGFITLTPDSIELSQRERPAGVHLPKLPALKIAQLGVDLGAQGRGVAKELIAFALLNARRVREQIGCVYLSVDAKPDVVEFYEKLGFKKNKAEIKRRQQREGPRYDESNAPVSMRFDIRAPGEAAVPLVTVDVPT